MFYVQLYYIAFLLNYYKLYTLKDLNLSRTRSDHKLKTLLALGQRVFGALSRLILTVYDYGNVKLYLVCLVWNLLLKDDVKE